MVARGVAQRCTLALAGALTLLTLLRSGQLLGGSERQGNCALTAACARSLREVETLRQQLKEAQQKATEAEHKAAEAERLHAAREQTLMAENARLKAALEGGPAQRAFSAADYEGKFLVASVEATPPSDLRALLRSLLGMAVLLQRTLVLPAALCNCRDAQLTQCDGAPVPPFDCPLREALRAERWQDHAYLRASGVTLRPARFLIGTPPEPLRSSHVRVLLPDGMDDSEMARALKPYDDRLLEVERAHAAFCGWDVRVEGNPAQMAAFDAAADELLQADGKPRAALGACTHYRGGTGEVLQFTNVGRAGSKTAVTASRDKLPASVRGLPADTDIMVTFATGSVAEMAANWVRNVRNAGVQEVLIGALDQSMLEACERFGVPCVLVDGGAVTAALAQRKAQNVREDPTLYPKMSVLKVGFYRELLSFGFNVWACDADAIFMNDPRPLVRSGAWAEADVAIATDCIDLPSDARYPLLHCDFNTGLVYLRATPAVLNFTDRWKETVANAREKRIRDQAAFNMITKQPGQPLRHWMRNGTWAERVFLASNGGDEKLRLLVLPLHRFLNGHTFFVQHAHTLAGAQPPISVHMTYQFGEGAKYAYGKRQRLREAGLWLVDPDEYYRGKFVMAAPARANLPLRTLNTSIDSREAVDYHLAEARHRAAVLRALLGIAKATGRDVILPRMLCYCDFMWKEMKACRVGGAESMRLPFDCPMDHALDTPVWFEHSLGVSVREPNFLASPRVPQSVRDSRAAVALPKGLDDRAVLAALAPHADAAIIEVEDAVGTFCGFADGGVDKAFRDETQRMLHYRRAHFCTMEGSDNAPPFSQCCTPRVAGDKFFPCREGFDPPEPLPACSAA